MSNVEVNKEVYYNCFSSTFYILPSTFVSKDGTRGVVGIYVGGNPDPRPSIDNNLILVNETDTCIYDSLEVGTPVSLHSNKMVACLNFYIDEPPVGDSVSYATLPLMREALDSEGTDVGDNMQGFNISSCLNDSYMFDSTVEGCDRTLDSGDIIFDTNGLNGTEAGWDFSNDLLGNPRTGTEALGWSIGAHEYD